MDGAGTVEPGAGCAEGGAGAGSKVLSGLKKKQIRARETPDIAEVVAHKCPRANITARTISMKCRVRREMIIKGAVSHRVMQEYRVMARNREWPKPGG